MSALLLAVLMVAVTAPPVPEPVPEPVITLDDIALMCTALVPPQGHTLCYGGAPGYCVTPRLTFNDTVRRFSESAAKDAEIARLTAELAKVREIKGCAKLEVVPPKTIPIDPASNKKS